jgi:hypothetical protein
LGVGQSSFLGRLAQAVLVLAGIVTFDAALSFGIERYRIPVDAVLPVLAAVGVDAWLRRRDDPPLGEPARADAAELTV